MACSAFKVRLISADFSHLRTDEEIARLLRAAEAEGEDTFALYTMAINTGMRVGELAGLLWSDVDLDRRLITVQRSFNGPTKADDVRYVPILESDTRDAVCDILEGAREAFRRRARIYGVT